jgi:hypothetical protein
LALFYGIADDSMLNNVAEQLVQRVHADSDHIVRLFSYARLRTGSLLNCLPQMVGMFGVKWLFQALSGIGQTPLAVTLATQRCRQCLRLCRRR